MTEIVALRAMRRRGPRASRRIPRVFANSVELIEALAATGRFTLRVGAYPERHPDAADPQADVDWLKRKIDAGASSAITQFFFEAETFPALPRCLRPRRDQRPDHSGHPADHHAGTAPTLRRRALRRTCARPLGRSLPLAARDGREDLLALTHCTTLCTRLIDEGVEDLHFYTLNRPHLTREVCHALGSPRRSCWKRSPDPSLRATLPFRTKDRGCAPLNRHGARHRPRAGHSRPDRTARTPHALFGERGRGRSGLFRHSGILLGHPLELRHGQVDVGDARGLRACILRHVSTRVFTCCTERVISVRARAVCSTCPRPSVTCDRLSRIKPLISRAALVERSARSRTSAATTANPLPASPARAASTPAFKARRFVWKAMSSITDMVRPTCSDDCAMRSIAVDICAASRPPSSAVAARALHHPGDLACGIADRPHALGHIRKRTNRAGNALRLRLGARREIRRGLRDFARAGPELGDRRLDAIDDRLHPFHQGALPADSRSRSSSISSR